MTRMTPALRPAGIAVLLVLTGMAAPVQAQTKGSLFWRAGVTQITPHVDSGDLSPPSFIGTKSDIEAATTVRGVSYMVTDNWRMDVRWRAL